MCEFCFFTLLLLWLLCCRTGCLSWCFLLLLILLLLFHRETSSSLYLSNVSNLIYYFNMLSKRQQTNTGILNLPSRVSWKPWGLEKSSSGQSCLRSVFSPKQLKQICLVPTCFLNQPMERLKLNGGQRSWVWYLRNLSVLLAVKGCSGIIES